MRETKWSFYVITIVSLHRCIVVLFLIALLVYQAESQILQRVICSVAAQFVVTVVGGVGEGFDEEENSHSNPLDFVLGSDLVNRFTRLHYRL